MASGLRRVACLGGGVIGGGWAARFALAGLDVCVYDPNPAAAQTVADSLAAARRAWQKLHSLPPREGEVRVFHREEELAAAFAGAALVQESLPEEEALKQRILVAIEPHIADDAIIASSTSGLLPSRLQSVLAHPQRFCVAHPFTPVYLLPLVEICAGSATAAETPVRAAAFYQSLGMQPLVLRREIDGFIADRLMEALWREALWLVHDDIATTGEIDNAIRLGCGLRWAFMGPFLTYRLGGGEGGMRHFMAQFAPALKLPWTKLMDVPEMDDALLDKIVAQTDAQAAEASPATLMQWRDDCLVALMQALANAGTGIGDALAAGGRICAAAKDGEGRAAAPLSYTTQVTADWIDYNGHMNEARYLQVASAASDALLEKIGVNAEYAAAGGGYYTVETHLRHLRQAYVDDKLAVATQVLAMDDKRLHLFHTISRADDEAVATAEQLLLHVANDRATAAKPDILEKLAAIATAHAALPPPPAAGKISLRR